MDTKKKVLVVVVVILGIAAIVLAYFFGRGELFQGYFRYQPTSTSTTNSLERLSTGQRIDSAEDDEAGLGTPVLEREEDSTVRRYVPLD